MPSGAAPRLGPGVWRVTVVLVPRGTLTGDPRRCTRAADGSASGVCIVANCASRSGRATSPDSKILAPIVFQTGRILVNAVAERFLGQIRYGPLERQGGSKQHDATATAPPRASPQVQAGPLTARQRRARPLGTSAKQLIFGRKIGEGTQGEAIPARHATTGKRYVVKILDLDDPDDPDDPSTVSSRAAANDAKRQVSSLTDADARRLRRRPATHALARAADPLSRHLPAGPDRATRHRADAAVCIG